MTYSQEVIVVTWIVIAAMIVVPALAWIRIAGKKSMANLIVFVLLIAIIALAMGGAG